MVILAVLNRLVKIRAWRVQVVIAESYGGRDEPVDTLVGSLVDINVTPVFDPVRVKAVPTEDTYQVMVQAIPRIVAMSTPTSYAHFVPVGRPTSTACSLPSC